MSKTTMLIGEWDGEAFRVFDVAKIGLVSSWPPGLPEEWCVADHDGITINYPIKDRLPPCILRVSGDGQTSRFQYTEDGIHWRDAPT